MREALGRKLLLADRDGNGVIEGDEFEAFPLLEMVDRSRDRKVEASEIHQWVAELPFIASRDRTSLNADRRAASQLGRYVPFEGGRMLDTTNGTLYAVSGDKWKPVATLDGAPFVEPPVSKEKLRDNLDEGKATLLRLEQREDRFEEQGLKGRAFEKQIEMQKKRIERLEKQLAE